MTRMRSPPLAANEANAANAANGANAKERAQHPRITRKLPDVRRNKSRLTSQQRLTSQHQREERKHQKKRPSIVARAVHTQRS